MCSDPPQQSYDRLFWFFGRLFGRRWTQVGARWHITGDRTYTQRHRVFYSSEEAENDMNPSHEWAGADELYRQLVPPAKRLAYLVSGDAEFAEDAVHDAFLNVVAKLGADANADDVESYLRKSVINQVKMGWRSTVRRYVRQSLYAAREPQREYSLDEDHDHELTTALSALTAKQRTVVVLTYYYDWDDQRIAHEIGGAVGTVKSTRARALKTLRKELGHEQQLGKVFDHATQTS